MRLEQRNINVVRREQDRQALWKYSARCDIPWIQQWIPTSLCFSRFVSEIAIDWNVIIAWKHIIYAVKKIPRFVSCFLMQISKVLSSIQHRSQIRLCTRSYWNAKVANDWIIVFRLNSNETFGRIRSIFTIDDGEHLLFVAHLSCVSPFVCAIDELEDFTRAFKSALIWNGLMYSLKLKTPWRRVFCMNASMTSAFSSVFLIWSIALDRSNVYLLLIPDSQYLSRLGESHIIVLENHSMMTFDIQCESSLSTSVSLMHITHTD